MIEVPLLYKLQIPHIVVESPSFMYGGERLNCLKESFQDVDSINKALSGRIIALYSLENAYNSFGETIHIRFATIHVEPAVRAPDLKKNTKKPNLGKDLILNTIDIIEI